MTKVLNMMTMVSILLRLNLKRNLVLIVLLGVMQG